MWFVCCWCYIFQRNGDCCRWCGCDFMVPATDEDRETNGRKRPLGSPHINPCNNIYIE
jgi:hypothetical protein